MTIRVRAAVPEDVPTILRFVRELADYERDLASVKATADDLLTALFGQDPSAECVIAESGGVATGFALFFRNFSTWTGKAGLYLEDLYVTPEARGTGAGKALLAHLAALTLARGWVRFEWSVLDWNAPAIGFYQSLGATQQNEWTVHRLTGDALEALARQA
jgi:GNAT superfamily N-acetyltransferase